MKLVGFTSLLVNTVFNYVKTISRIVFCWKDIYSAKELNIDVTSNRFSLLSSISKTITSKISLNNLSHKDFKTLRNMFPKKFSMGLHYCTAQKFRTYHLTFAVPDILKPILQNR